MDANDRRLLPPSITVTGVALARHIALTLLAAKSSFCVRSTQGDTFEFTVRRSEMRIVSTAINEWRDMGDGTQGLPT